MKSIGNGLREYTLAMRKNKQEILMENRMNNIPKDSNEESESAGEKVFKNVKIGDVLKGRVILEDKQLFLEVNKLIRVPISEMQNTQINRLLDFQVLDKTETHLVLEPFRNELEQLISKVIVELALKNEDETIEVVRSFIEESIMLEKKEIQNTVTTYKKYPLPPTVLRRILTNPQLLENKMLQDLLEISQKGVANYIGDNIEEIMIQAEKKEDVYFILKAMTQANEQVADRNSESLHLKQENDLANTNQRVLANQLAKLVEKTLPAIELEKSGDAKGVTSEVLNKWDILDEENKKEILVQIASSKKMSIALSGQVVKRMFTLDHKEKSLNLESKTHSERIFQSLLSEVEKEEGNKDNPFRTFLEEASHVIKQSEEYVGYMPIFPYDEKMDLRGEAYFLESNQQGGKKDKRYYVVITLDLPNLRHIKINVKTIGKEIGVDIEVEQTRIKEVIDGYMNKLADKIENKGYTMITYNCRVAKKQKKILPTTTGFDYKV